MPDSRIERLRQEAKAMSDEELITRLRDVRAKRNASIREAKAQPRAKKEAKSSLRDLLKGMSREDILTMLGKDR